MVIIAKCLKGGCRRRECQLPYSLATKKALLSIDCPEGLCFAYSVAAYKKTDGFTKKKGKKRKPLNAARYKKIPREGPVFIVCYFSVAPDKIALN